MHTEKYKYCSTVGREIKMHRKKKTNPEEGTIPFEWYMELVCTVLIYWFQQLVS